MLDRAANRLARLLWTPRIDLAVSYIDLEGDVPDEIMCPSLAGHKLVFQNEEESVFGVNLNTGWMGEIWRFSGLTVLTPCGNWLVGATDRGLLTKFFWSLDPDAPLKASDVQPALVKGLDLSDALVIPGATTDQFNIALGCYGSVELAAFSNVARNSTEAMHATSRSFTADGLPYDPICLNDPSLMVPPLFGDVVYAMDHGRCNVIAIDTRTDQTFSFLKFVPGYVNLQRAVTSFDSNACLVTLKHGEIMHWIPGSEPRPVSPIAGQTMIWRKDRALMIDRERDLIAEVAITPVP